MTDSKDTRGTILWVSHDASSRELVGAGARDFKLVARFCAPAEVLPVLRASHCDLLGLELDPDPRDGLALLRDLHERLPRLNILAASSDTSVPIMRAALERGAADFLTLPLSRQELHKAFIKFTQLASRQAASTEMGEVYTVYGTRGGLGVTTLAVNLATRLRALTGADIALADLDLQRGDVAAFLNMTPSQSLAAMAGARGDVDEIYLHGMLTRHPSGVFVLAAPGRIEEADTISLEDVKLALRLLRSQFRFTVVDTPRTITGSTLAALEDADRILMLTDLTVPGVRSARRTVELLQRLEVPSERLALIVTRAVGGPVDLREAVRTIGKEPYAVLPADEDAAGKAMNSGVPLNGLRPAGLSLAIGEIAAKLAGISAPPKPQRVPLLRRFFSKESRT